MVPFDVQLPKRTVFGRNRAKAFVPQLAGVYERPLIVHGASADRALWLVDVFAGATTVSCAAEPDTHALERTLGRARSQNVDAVIAIGGGAVIDLGKAVAGLAGTSRPLHAYLEVVGEGHCIDAAPLPFVAIPTTAGTGAEATPNAVIGVPEHHRKVSVRDSRMLADWAIVDPALTDGCPRAITLASGLDAITQLIEPYLSRRANAFTDAMVRQALEPALRSIRVLAEREDKDARDAMAFASHTSGIALSHAGLGAVHGLAGVVGGMTGAPHGEICATLLAPTLAVNARAVGAQRAPRHRIDEIEALLATHFDDQPGSGGFARLSNWVRTVGIRPLAQMGVKQEDHRSIAQMAQASSSMKANPVDLGREDLIEIQGVAM